MTHRQLINYLKKLPFLKKPRISRLGKGNNYQTYLIQDIKQEYVARLARRDVLAEDKLRDEYHILNFLRQERINFIQRPVFYDSKNSISILTYLKGRDIGVNDLNIDELERFIYQLNLLHRIKYKRYQKYCRRNKIKIIKSENIKQTMNRYGWQRFKEVEKKCPDRRLIAWIKLKLLFHINSLKKIKWGRKIVFQHGDLAGGNIIKNKAGLFFIDWDKAHFVYLTDFGLAYMFIHGLIKSKMKQQKIISLYAKYARVNINWLNQAVNRKILMIKLNDIIWATMMFTEMKLKNKKNYLPYQKMAYRRIREYNKITTFHA